MKKLLLLLGDILILYISLFLTLYIRYGQDFRHKIDVHLLPFSSIFIVWVLFFYIANLYDIGFSKNNNQFFSTLLYSIATISFVSVAFFYLIPFLGITPKTNLFIFIVLATLLQFAWRYYFNNLTAKSGYKNNTLIIGANQESQELYDFLLNNPQLGYGALGIIDIEDDSVVKILGNLIKEKGVRTLVLSPSAYKIPRIIDVFYGLLGFNVTFYNISDFYEQTTGKVPLGSIDQAWFLENLSEASKRGYEIVKRIFDLIFVAIIGILSLPFWPFILLAIKLDSRGVIFYHQLRVGRAGNIFSLVKLRSMVQDVEGKTGPVWATENDSRTTGIGKFLRRTRIDEIPQIWNILKGDMSLVGPRPERPEFHQKLEKEIPFYDERYLVKPGLIGWAQIKYKLDFRGGMTVQDTAEKLQYDLYYIKNRSPLLDLEIILKTISILLGKLFR